MRWTWPGRREGKASGLTVQRRLDLFLVVSGAYSDFVIFRMIGRFPQKHPIDADGKNLSFIIFDNQLASPERVEIKGLAGGDISPTIVDRSRRNLLEEITPFIVSVFGRTLQLIELDPPVSYQDDALGRP